MERRYWTVLFLPPSILLALYMASAMQHWLWRPLQQENPQQSNPKAALLLLQHQQAQLLAMLNSSTSAAAETSKEFVVHQLEVNRELQQILQVAPNLNTTRTDGGDIMVGSNVSNAISSGGGCVKLKREETARSAGIAWRPQPARFLVMICDSGQVTNHLICLQKHMFFGALLNRTLVLPDASLDYKYEHLLDIGHIKKCLGNATVVTFSEFRERRSKQLHIEKLICYMPNCYFDNDHQSKWEALGFTFGERLDAWSSSAMPHVRAANILARFACEEEVIAVGDLYYAQVEDAADFAVAHVCGKNLVQPHRLIMLTAQRFVQTYLGSNFLSLHFRRHGFLVFCNKQPPSCFYPIPQAAECIQRKLQASNAKVIFLSTDASGSEITELQGLLSSPVVMRTKGHEAEAKWDALLWRKGLESDPAVMAMVDKATAAMGAVFIGTRGSTFSDDIQRMRVAWGTAASCDANLCDAEVPSFLAELP